MFRAKPWPPRVARESTAAFQTQDRVLLACTNYITGTVVRVSRTRVRVQWDHDGALQSLDAAALRNL
jgi:hypothetical protein